VFCRLRCESQRQLWSLTSPHKRSNGTGVKIEFNLPSIALYWLRSHFVWYNITDSRKRNATITLEAFNALRSTHSIRRAHVLHLDISSARSSFHWMHFLINDTVKHQRELSRVSLDESLAPWPLSHACCTTITSIPYKIKHHCRVNGGIFKYAKGSQWDCDLSNLSRGLQGSTLASMRPHFLFPVSSTSLPGQEPWW